VPSDIYAQEVNYEDGTYEDVRDINSGYDWTIKVVWVDAQGKKQRINGRVLLAHDSGIIIRQTSASGRSTQKSIPARSIVKMKYRPSSQPLPDVLAGAFDGALGNGPFQIATGNFGLDLLAGALTGAVGGLLSSPREPKRVVWVKRDIRIYRDRVLPELGYTSNSQ